MTIAIGIVLVLGMPKIQEKLEINRIEKENIRTIEKIKKTLTTNEITTEEKIPKIEETNEIEEIKIEKEGYIKVNFICQAPLQTVKNWELHEESCEEAALLQTYLYETGQTMTKEEANEEILAMIEWEKINFGAHEDIYADKIKEFAIGFYGIKDEEIKIIYNASIEDIKKEISKGHPVIAPVTAGILENPYYPYPGYHMLQVIGYTEDKIITNDNGTRKGADFSYDIEKFEQAMKDSGGDIITLELNKN